MPGDPVVIAAIISSIFGLGSSLAAFYFSRKKQNADTTQMLAEALETAIPPLRAEIEVLRGEVTQWKKAYQELKKDYDELKEKYEKLIAGKRGML